MVSWYLDALSSLSTVGTFLMENTLYGQFIFGKLAEACKTYIQILSTLRMLVTSPLFVFEVRIAISRWTNVCYTLEVLQNLILE
jgi:hypothetical protein